MGCKAVVARGFADGGKGMTDMAEAVIQEIESGRGQFRQIYDWNLPVKEKIATIAKEIYGATDVKYSGEALTALRKIERLGLDKLPLCMAKTQKSFSDDEKKIGRPEGFTITVRDFEFAAGAGFIIPILGKMMRMPGLPNIPASEGMTIDSNGVISGLS